ncbi:polysaccharide biosynthesis protein [Acidimangrovimonas pyrenivorans]|uniref:Polysaccharide biosynthesis protein n=1 Tax=Acidimangrovimonas pyrenivorans TaxID=2030798 RepID=A0ABV7ALZ1_9RHOB
MRIIFHVGMGKTGTSSVQHALATSTERLAAQKVAYLGMWFDAIDPGFRGYEGQERFFTSDAATMESHAEQFYDRLAARSAAEGIETFVLSNEAIYGNVHNFTPFLRRLQAKPDVALQIVAYIRNPYAWLPSAYAQWGIRHKQQPGSIQPYGQRARDLLGIYSGFRAWAENFGDCLAVRRHDKGIDVLADFAETTGLALESMGKRQLERAEPAETLLRALFNNRFEEPVLPERFERVVVDTSLCPVPSLHDMTEFCFRHDETAEIIDEQRPLFEFIRDRLGIDYLSETPAPAPPPDEAEIQRRMIDYLVEITLNQAQRLKRLERQIKDLRDAQ